MARNKKKAGKNRGVLDHPISNANREEMETNSTSASTEIKSSSFLDCLFLDKSPYNMFAVADAEYKYFKMKVRC